MGGFQKKKKMAKDKINSDTRLYLVDVISTFRIRYVVKAKSEEHALDEVVCRENDSDFEEFSQKHIGTQIFSSRKVSKEKYLELFNKDNDYLSSWSDEQKLSFINEISYKE